MSYIKAEEILPEQLCKSCSFVFWWYLILLHLLCLDAILKKQDIRHGNGYAVSAGAHST